MPIDQTITPESADRETERRMAHAMRSRETVLRYLSQTHRIGVQTLHELEDIQTRRKGGQTLLQRLDQ